MLYTFFIQNPSYEDARIASSEKLMYGMKLNVKKIYVNSMTDGMSIKAEKK